MTLAIGRVVLTGILRQGAGLGTRGRGAPRGGDGAVSLFETKRKTAGPGDSFLGGSGGFDDAADLAISTMSQQR